MAPAGKLGEGATAVTGAELCERLFQSAPPREGGDRELISKRQELTISIHAPREGGDDYEKLDVSGDGHFNPRPREGGDAVGADESHDVERFQSTPPARGGDPSTPAPPARPTNFNPRPPARGATFYYE